MAINFKPLDELFAHDYQSTYIDSTGHIIVGPNTYSVFYNYTVTERQQIFQVCEKYLPWEYSELQEDWEKTMYMYQWIIKSPPPFPYEEYTLSEEIQMDIETLKDELNIDPLSRGYASMSDEEAAINLNTVYRTMARDYVAGWEIFNVTDDTEYGALTDSQKASWDALCGIDNVSIDSGIAKSREAELFGPGTTTRDNLISLKTLNVSRGVELGLGVVKVGHIEEARR
jgi:hypothetical protein